MLAFFFFKYWQHEVHYLRFGRLFSEETDLYYSNIITILSIPSRKHCKSNILCARVKKKSAQGENNTKLLGGTPASLLFSTVVLEWHLNICTIPSRRQPWAKYPLQVSNRVPKWGSA